MSNLTNILFVFIYLLSMFFYERKITRLRKKAKKAYGYGRSEGVDASFQCFQQMHTNLIYESKRLPDQDGKMYTISMFVDRQDKDINE